MTQLLYKNAFHFSEGYAYLLDRNCTLVDCNNNLRNFLGLGSIREKQPGAIYKIMEKNGLWTKDQIAQIKQKDIDIILNGEAQLATPELPLIDENEDVLYFEGSRIPVKDSKENVQGLLVIFKDVTEEKQLNDQMHKIKEQLQAKNAAANTSEHSSNEKKTAAPRILIVEDNVIAQKAAQAILMNNDCLVDIAEGEETFYKLFVPGKYDLVFMDIGLENTSGYMMAKQLRTLEDNTGFHVPIIALTGYDSAVVEPDCDYYQMDGVITKPLTAEQVKQIIQHYIFHINLEITGFKALSHNLLYP